MDGGLEHRPTVLAAFAAALRAAEPGRLLRRAVRFDGAALHLDSGPVVPLPAERRVHLVGAGKAAGPMTRAALDLVGAHRASGTLSLPHGSPFDPIPGIQCWEGGHPLPDVHSLAGAAAALRVARNAEPGDLLLCLLSGGASALWTAPTAGVTLGEARDLTLSLLRTGAPIGALNAVRKHLSGIAGGRLLQTTNASEVVTLALSDVIGSAPEAIGSGPTAVDPTTFADALEVVRRYGVSPPPAVMRHLQRGAAGEVPETLKPGDPAAARGVYGVIGSVEDAVSGAAGLLESRGYRVRIIDLAVEGEAREVGERIGGEAVQARREGAGQLALLWGGETTVTVRGGGKGGRNQEVALAGARAIRGEAGIALASLATDGVDGPTDAAGAIVDGGTVERARARGTDPDAALGENDAYTALAAAGDLVRIGRTGTNVNDVIIALVDER